MEADLTVREIMTREYVGVSESDALAGAVELLLDDGAEAAVVLRGTEPVGVLTAADALARLTEGPGESRVEEAMSAPPPAIDPAESFTTAAATLADVDVDCLLVGDGEEVLGVVTERDVVGATASLAGRTETPAAVDATPAAGAAGGEAAADYPNQSVCEICGTLTADLQNFNGQLICADCREV